MTRTAATAELTRLQNLTPTTIASFAQSRAARISELTTLIETLPADTDPEVKDERVENLLSRVQGGDRFGR